MIERDSTAVTYKPRPSDAVIRGRVRELLDAATAKEAAAKQPDQATHAEAKPAAITKKRYRPPPPAKAPAPAKAIRKRQPRGAASPTSKERLEAAGRQLSAYQLRLSGRTFAQIAVDLGYADPSSARKAVLAFAQLFAEREGVNEARDLELARLDALTFGSWSAAVAGRYLHVDRVLAISKRRAALLGLDAPKRQEHSGPDGGPIPLATLPDERFGRMTDAELEEVIVDHQRRHAA